MSEPKVCPSCGKRSTASVRVGDKTAAFYACGSFRLLQIEGNGDVRNTDVRTIMAKTSDECGRNGTAITDEKLESITLADEDGVMVVMEVCENGEERVD